MDQGIIQNLKICYKRKLVDSYMMHMEAFTSSRKKYPELMLSLQETFLSSKALQGSSCQNVILERPLSYYGN